MCRIAGLINAALPENVLKDTVQQMCDLQKHGGPDDSGLYTSVADSLVLGNRRLALLDLSAAGHQPMVYQNRYHITYNGELYNFISLKEELKNLGHSFHTHTDTEVILAAFAQWNTLAFARFNGMFAFAIWDDQQKELLLVRDAAGMKPLYYSTASGGLAFASEIRAFKPVSYLQQPNSNWPVFLMAYGHIPEPVTTLKEVKPLHKGFFLKYETRSGKQSLQSFAHYSYSLQQLDSAETSSSLVKAFSESVERHLIADAPVGVFLSGGLDSSIIASVAAGIKKSDLNSLSLYFEEKQYSEKKYQDILLEELQVKPHQYLLKESDFHEFFPEIMRDMDMPGCDGINTWFISKLAAQQGLKAVLSGIGADELFGGYPSFRRIEVAGMMQQVPYILISAGARSRIKKFNRVSYLKMDGIKGIYLFLRGHFTPNDIARRLDATEKEIWSVLNELPVLNEINNVEIKNQASWMEFNMYMQNQLLRDADVMGMAHGVEIRIPFLDDSFVRLALSIDPAIKYGGQLPKQFLIDCYKSSLPKSVWNRPKMGFSFPFQKWLSNSSYVKEMMHNSNAATQYFYQRFMQGGLHWSQLMSIILLSNVSEI